ncbi:MAG: MATE family efflux transporter [bacterium]|nr:MATE family efflux transporter [bacterium]
MTYKNVELLFEHPSKSIWKLASPTIFANFVQIFYNLVDAFWISTLKNSSLGIAGIGLAQPLNFAALAIAGGIGVGTNSLISRSIGARDYEKANKAAANGIFLSLVISAITSLILLIFAKKIFTSLGAGEALPQALKYGRIIFISMPISFLVMIFNYIFRAEGDTKRSMIAMVTGSALNIVLDPIAIFALKLGIVGVAFATVISQFFSLMLFTYWAIFQKSTFVRIHIRDFKPDSPAMNEIIKVGFPFTLSQFLISLSQMLFNHLTSTIRGPQGIAIYSIGMRLNQFAILPSLGISAATISVVGAWFGAKRMDMVKKSIIEAWKLGIKIQVIVAIVIYTFAPYLAGIFANDVSMKVLMPDIVKFLRITSLTYIFTPVGMYTSSAFNGMGQGVKSAILTFCRLLIIAYPTARVLAINLDMGLTGVWWGLNIAPLGASIIAVIWLKLEKIL